MRDDISRKYTFLKINKQGETYTPLPEDVLKVRKREVKALVEAGSGEKFGRSARGMAPLPLCGPRSG